MLHSRGWQIVYYGSDGRDQAGILEILGLVRHARRLDSFTYRNAYVNIIAVSNAASAMRRRFLLFHECGHVLLAHDLRYLTGKDEARADIFAQYCLDWFRHYAARIRICLFCFLLLTVSLLSFLAGSVSLLYGNVQRPIYVAWVWQSQLDTFEENRPALSCLASLSNFNLKGEKLMNAAAYARYSTDSQTENSIAYQMEAIETYCARHGLTLVKKYCDEAKTGTSISKRDGFQQLLRDAERHLFDAIVIYDISRGSRNIVDWFSFRKQMLRLNIEVFSTCDNLGDPLDPACYISEAVTATFAEHYVLDIRKKSRAGVKAKARQAVFLGGTAPLGYDIVNQKYVINETEARYVRTIFEMYAAGRSYNDIILALQQMGAVGKAGRPLGKNSLYTILLNDRYHGVYSWNRHVYRVMHQWAGHRPNKDVVEIKDAIPKIVDDFTWDAVQARLKDRDNGRNKARRREYLLSGCIICENCGATFVGHTSVNQKGIETSFYACGNKYRTKTCKMKNINATAIETVAVNVLRDYLQESNLDSIAARVCDMVNNASADLSAEKAELADIDRQLHNGMKVLLRGRDFPELEAEMDRLRLRKSTLQDVIANAGGPAPLEHDQVVRYFLSAIHDMESHNLRSALRKCIKIYAHADGSYTICVGANLNVVTCTGCGRRI